MVIAKIKSAKHIEQIAAQVAHDIRSPLAALDSVLGSITRLPEEERLIIRSATSRIRDIANHLLAKHPQEGRTDAAQEPPRGEPSLMSTEVCLLSSLIDPIITEKRLQFRSNRAIEIDAPLNSVSYGHFARVQARELKRIVSNLVNNSVEALEEKGSVVVSLGRQDERVLLKVQDNGKGVPLEILSKLGQKGETHGKTGGSGLGLYHAKTCVESWGGSLNIESQIGKGTTVTIGFPRAEPPQWFVSELKLDPQAPIVILDDDPTIHQVWQGRLDSLGTKGSGLEIHHFSTPAELRGWVEARKLTPHPNPLPQGERESGRKVVYLMDYELLGFQETGLALIEELNLGERAILVTSRFEEEKILKDCRRLSVRLIPKNLVGFVPIKINHPHPALPPQGGGENKIDVILIDDDLLVHKIWQRAAKTHGQNLKTFKSPQEFLDAGGDQFPLETAIYLDSELGNGVKGEYFAQELHAKGFANLYLAAGHSPEKFGASTCLKAIVGKEPPWSC
ncbi:MAG: HAMP domain-containing histidine kinase [Elusimicrobia bacterium]|nr:HAMP domain-containing histidine kinase [Elusimicrobiota bacterium]